MTTTQRTGLAIIFATAGVLLLGVAGSFLLLVQLSLEAVHAGRETFHLLGVEIAHPIVERIVERRAESTMAPVDALVHSTLVSKFLLVLGFSVLAAVALVFRRRVRRLVVDYFTATTHPMNLAIFRVLLFGFAAFMIGYEYLMLFVSLPESFIVPPVGMGWLLDILPIRPGLATWTYGVFLAATISAALGLATRISAIAAVVFGTYVLGIPNFYGKVDHYNHVLWFMAILAASPAGDTLSIDALLRAWRRGGPDTPVEPAVRYALPLRIVWLAIGICYFFPGLWKLAEGGLAWALGDTFRTILYRQWAGIPGFQAPFALDQYPVLYRAAASAAVAFELTFVFLILFPRIRRLAVAAGLAFHNLTGLLMSIWFLPMQVSYAAFVDWRRVLRWIGTQAFPNEAVLRYDVRNAAARRVVSITRHLDLLQRVTFQRSDSTDHGRTPSLRLTLRDETVVGWRAWIALLPRVPLATLLAPALLLAGCPGELDRSDRPPSRRLSNAQLQPAPATHRATLPVAIVGGAVLAINSVFGALAIEAGWPFASYPTFATVRHANVDRLHVTKIDSDGRAIELELSAVIERIKYPKFGPLVSHVVKTEDATLRREKLTVLHRLIAESVGGLAASDEVILRLVTTSADPAQRDAVPAESQLLARFGPSVRR